MACVVDHVVGEVELAHRRGVDVPEPVQRVALRGFVVVLEGAALKKATHSPLGASELSNRVLERRKMLIGTPNDEVWAG